MAEPAQPFGSLPRFFLDDERAQARVSRAFARRLDAREQLDVVGAVGERAPVFVAGDHPLVAVEHRATADGRQIGADVRFRQRHGREIFAARGFLRQFDALLDRPAAHAHHAAGARDDAGHAHPAARQFFRDQAVLEHAEAEPAVFFRRADAEVTELAHLAAQVHRNLALHRVEFVGHRQHFVHRELARGRLNHQAFFCQVR